MLGNKWDGGLIQKALADLIFHVSGFCDAEALQLGAASVAREMFQGMQVTFVSADRRMLDAARAEHFHVLDPAQEAE